MKEFIHTAALRWAFILSLSLHVLLLGWAGAYARLEMEPDIESLQVVQVDPDAEEYFPPLNENEEVETPLETPLPSPLTVPISPPLRQAHPRPRPESPSVETFPPAERSATRPASRPRTLPASPRARRPGPKRRAPGPPSRRGSNSAGTGMRTANPRSGGPPVGAPRPLGETPSGGTNPSGEGGEEGEAVPEGPVDLEPVKSEEGGVVQLSRITRGALNAQNANEKGQVRVALASEIIFEDNKGKLKTYDGPGVFCTATLKIPESTPPGTVYKLELAEVVLAGENGEKISFKYVPGALTVLPKMKPLPPAEPPPTEGATLGLGRVYAHRGDTVKLEVFAGEAVKGVSGFQAIIRFSDITVGKRQGTKPAASSGSSPPPSPSAP